MRDYSHLSKIDPLVLIEILQNQSHFTAILSPEGKIIAVNKTALDFAGVGENEVIGTFFWHGPWWRHSKPAGEQIRRAIQSIQGVDPNDTVQFSTTNRNHLGDEYSLDFSLKAIRDKSGRIIFLVPEGKNQSCCENYGYNRETLIGMHLHTLITPAYHHELDRFITELSHRGYFEGYTIDQRSDGTTFHTHVKGSKILFREHDCFLAIVRDISEQKLAELALKEQEHIYRALFQNNHSVILLIESKSGQIFDANPAACEFYGYERSALQKMRIADINTLPSDEIEKEIRLASRDHKNYFNFQHRLADGSTRDVEVHSGPLEVKGKSLLCSIIHDVTDRKKIENERDNLIGDLQKTLAEIKTLRGILPICSHCKKIRDDSGYWNQLEAYLDTHSDVKFSHGICPDCIIKLYPDFLNETEEDE